MNNLAITCQLDDILLERENGFKLHIPTFMIPAERTHAEDNKIPFMGVSGAGKSTLLNIMAAIEWPQRGTVRWNFPDERHSAIEWSQTGPTSAQAKLLRRKFFGYAFQDSTLMEHLRVGENLSYPLLLKGYSTAKADVAARAALKKVLIGDEHTQLDDYFKRFPFELSGGQRQRISLVQAMIHDPYVLFADEPTGSLDVKTRQQVMQVLYDWVDDSQHRGKRLLVWVTHHENDPGSAAARHYLYIQSGQEPQWKNVNRQI